jgi:hypothetical protein
VSTELQAVQQVMKPSIYDELRVRIATVADMPEVMELAVAAAKENSLFDCSRTRLIETVWRCLNLDHGLIGAIGKQNGTIEGMVVLVIGNLHYSDSLCCEEKVLWVNPEFRNAKGGRANKLIRFMKGAAASLNLPLVTGVLSHDSTEAKRALYTRELGAPAGYFWVWGNAKTGGHKVLP